MDQGIKAGQLDEATGHQCFLFFELSIATRGYA